MFNIQRIVTPARWLNKTHRFNEMSSKQKTDEHSNSDDDSSNSSSDAATVANRVELDKTKAPTKSPTPKEINDDGDDDDDDDDDDSNDGSDDDSNGGDDDDDSDNSDSDDDQLYPRKLSETALLDKLFAIADADKDGVIEGFDLTFFDRFDFSVPGYKSADLALLRCLPCRVLFSLAKSYRRND